MKNILSLFVVFALGTPVAAATATDQLEMQARQKTKALAGALQTELKASLQKDGPVAAIQVCHERAPVIAKQISADGWVVGRTALKIRNPDNIPDEWERETLSLFAKELAKGVSANKLSASAIKESTYRYMQAIPTGGVCLTCHGENLSPDIAQQISLLYPDDKAIGFRLGQLRGAFTLSKSL
jgi:hypothetical protein